MVVVASSQPNELEQKKKRQTLERAKASHLSKQLQMRLQYAKLKVEHGWQRQNLNEVENLYFHHSIRHGHAAPRPHYAVAYANTHGNAAPATVLADAPVLSDHALVGPLPSEDSLASAVSVYVHAHNMLSPPSDCIPNPDGLPSPSVPFSVPTPLPGSVTAPSALTNRPPSASALDLSDPNILARLVQLHAQMPMGMPQGVSLAQMSVPPLPTPTAASAPVPGFVPGAPPLPLQVPLPVPTSTPGLDPAPNTTFPPIHPHGPHPAHPTHPIAFSPFPAPPFVTTPPLYPPSTTPAQTGPAATSQPPIATSAPPTTQPPIAPTALTYDSFWSTHASSTGPTRALYRTHTGFSASATPTGNVAMLTPGGHAAVMTAEGVYVGGANSRTAN